MAAPRARTYLQSTIDVVKRGGDQPPWWNVATVAVGLVVFVVFVWSLMSDTSSTTTPSPVDAAPAASAQPDLDTAPTSAPAEPSGTDELPAGKPQPDTGPGSGETTTVKTVAGAETTVPSEAYLVARSALVGQFDPAEAAHVEMASGETFPAPATQSPNATYSPLTLDSGDEESLAFVASADPDGQGPQPTIYFNLRVIKQGGEWKFTNEL